jgi:predicted PurR-regulated permease PerM
MMNREEKEEVLWQCFWATLVGGALFGFAGALVGVTLVCMLHAVNASPYV